MTGSEDYVSRLDTGVAHTARTWNYWLGGKDNFAPDREVGEQILQFLPNMRITARADRAFLGRAVRFLAGEAGIRQFLDVGTGLPTADNTHEVAQAVAPESRIVYVDNDPLVLVHARALLTSTPQGVTNYVEADLHDPDKVLQEAARTLDFSQPVALTLLGVLNFVVDDDEAQAVINRLLDAVPPGSIWRLPTPATKSIPQRRRRHGSSGMNMPSPPSPSAPRGRSRGSSSVWSCSTQVWSHVHGGGPRPATWTRRKWICSVVSADSPGSPDVRSILAR
jgi:hypothetical protein